MSGKKKSSPKKKAAPAPEEVEEKPLDEGEFDDEDLIAMQKKIAEMEAEAKAAEEELAAAVKESEAETPAGEGGKPAASSTAKEGEGEGDKKEEFVKANDELSVFVKGVDWGATPEELQKHFQPCGPIQRITILVDKYTQRPKGIAYVEFMDNGSKENALLLDDSEFRGRKIQVSEKRTNVFGMGRGRGRGRGGFRGRGRGGFRGGYGYRGRGRGFRGRGRGRGGYHPYY